MLIVFTASGLQLSSVTGPFRIAAQRRALQNSVGIGLVAVRPRYVEQPNDAHERYTRE
jgi:hypothetical protein